MSPAAGQQGNTLPYCFSSYYKQVIFFLFCSLLGATFFEFLCFFLVILLLKMATKHSAEVLSTVPKHRKAAMCLMEKIHMLDNLPSGMSYSAVGREFNAHESTKYVKECVFKQGHT